MNAWLGIVTKEFLHLRRDPRALLMIVVMPIALLVIFGAAIRNEVSGIKIGIVDESRTPASRAIVSAFAGSPQFDLQPLPRGQREAVSALEDGRVEQVLVIDRRYGRHDAGLGPTLQLLADGSDPSGAQTAAGYATNVLLAQAGTTTSGATTQATAGASAGTAPRAGTAPAISRMRYNPTLASAPLFVPGLVTLILTIVCALMTSISITRERETGTLETLLVSQLRPFALVTGKLLPYLVIAALEVVVTLAIAHAVFDVPVRGSAWLVALVATLFMLASLSLGLLVGNRSATQQAATLASMTSLMMPNLLLSGFMFPVDSLPGPLRAASAVIPARWFLSALRAVLLRGASLADIGPDVAVLAGLTVLCVLAGILSFRSTLD